MVGSLVLIILQLRQSIALTKAANAQALVEHASAFNALLIGDEALANFWYGGGRELRNMGSVRRYRELLVQWLIFHKNIFYQREKHLLDEDVYNTWLENMRCTVHAHDMRLVADDLIAFPRRVRAPSTRTASHTVQAR